MGDAHQLPRYAARVTTRRERDQQREPVAEGAVAEDWQARLGQMMEARALSGGELARRAGFTSQYVNSLRSGDRGARLPLDTARKLAHALGVSVDWLTKGEGPRERLSDVFVVGASGTATPYRPPAPSDLYPSRSEAIALLGKVVEPEVIEALRAVVPETDGDPGREFWIAYAKDLARDLRRITNDPDLNARRDRDAPPKSAYMPTAKKKS
ncbi:MAG: Bacteriophage repressor helix-turn-helix domain [Myxococcales bacterium]|nr:Bacteriophage repressor helix-turn-helix domain [Myxococcales bacterium]